jgi:hypothetical protein
MTWSRRLSSFLEQLPVGRVELLPARGPLIAHPLAAPELLCINFSPASRRASFWGLESYSGIPRERVGVAQRTRNIRIYPGQLTATVSGSGISIRPAFG